jgi:hypothetical protein
MSSCQRSMMRVHVAHELVGHEINGKGCRDMKFSNRLVPAALFVLAMVVPTASKAQATTQKTESKTIPSPELEMQKKNVQAYVDLLRHSAGWTKKGSAIFRGDSVRRVFARGIFI